ncbi:MAG TPA: glycosyltransferase family 2 protein [Kineosporiaceae bacterium]
MYARHRIAVVVPAYAEEKHVGDVISAAPDFVDHIVVVDDASPDATSEVALAVGDPRVEVIRHEHNTGVGGAIITGHQRAMDLGADIDVVMAGDHQMDPAYLPALLDPIVNEGYGFTKANRFFSATSFKGMPRHRIFGNVALTFLTKVASGYWNLVDPQNGYTAVRTDVLRRLPLHRIAKRYEFENDLLIWLNILDVRALDVPVPAVYRDEVSHVRLGPFVLRMLRLLVSGFWRRVWLKYVLWSFSPVALLLVTGTLLVAVGVAFGIWVIAETIGPSTASAGTVLLAVTPFLVGTQLLVQALVLDIQATPK